MSVTIEKLEGLERSLQLELPWADIEAAVQKRLQATQKRARVDGFRPGKAPLRMIESMYGAGIRDEVLNDSLIPKTSASPACSLLMPLKRKTTKKYSK